MVEQSSHSPRPTAQKYLTLARVVGLGTSCAAAFSVGLGIWPEAMASGGANVALPFVAGAVISILLTAGWHVALGYAAHAGVLHEKAIAAGFGVALFLIGIGCSGWFMASMLAGHAAIQAHQHEYLRRLAAAADIAAANAAAERNLISSINSAGSNLAKTANAEGTAGIVSGKVGQNVVWNALKNAAEAFSRAAVDLDGKREERDDILSRAREDIRDAQRASTAHDDAAFQERVTDAAAQIAAANAIRFAPNITGLGNGFAPGHARSVIDETVRNVQADALAISKQRRAVEIPGYESMDAKRAILSYPQPLAWIVATVIELLPLLMLGLMLALWRDAETRLEPDPMSQSTAVAAE